MRLIRSRLGFALLVLGAAWGCTDFGEEWRPDSAPADGDGTSGWDPPSLTKLGPGRTVVGDTLRVQGSGFGDDQGFSAVLFTGADLRADVEADIAGWSDTEILALVPGGASDGPVWVRVNGVVSETLPFDVADSLISYQGHVRALFYANHCMTSDCHGWTGVGGGLSLQFYARMMQGGDNGPSVIPRRSGESLLWRTLEVDTLGIRRMPPDGLPFVTDREALLVADWIDQGARNN